MATTAAAQHDDRAPFDLVVVGGGPAGLSHAYWRLREQPDLRVLVLEATPRLGGWVQTLATDGFQLELGPQGFRPEPGGQELLQHLGIADDVVPCSASSKRRFLLQSGQCHELPSGPGSLLRTRLLRLRDKLRLLWEPRVRSQSPPSESVAAFVSRRFGEGTSTFAEAMMHGIYAGDAHALEIAATMPIATELEREHGSLLRGMRALRKQRTGPRPPTVCSFANGMQQSVDALRRELDGRTRTDADVTALSRTATGFQVAIHGQDDPVVAREVCLTTPPPITARILRAFDDELATTVAAIPTVNVTSTYLGFAEDQATRAVDGFGALAPQGESNAVLGVLFSSRVFPHQAPAGHVLFRVMSGGFAHPGEVDRTDTELARQARACLESLFGISATPVLQHVSRARQAIPQYVHGHGERMHTLHERLANLPGLHLRGASYRKVSVVGQWVQAGSTP